MEDSCPLCPATKEDIASYDTWLQCDACSTWYHTKCLNYTSEYCDRLERFHCASCTPTHGPTTFKAEQRKSTRERTKLNYADLNEGRTADQKIWSKILRAKAFAEDPFRRYTGQEVTKELFEKIGMREPVIINDPEGLDMSMPPSTTTVRQIAQSIGYDHPVEVIDVATQAELPGWTMGRWADYYDNTSRRDRIRNVISLEISGTDFAKDIVRPRVVRDMDWIDHIWPQELKPSKYPKVQLYCLMGTQDSYTDFHIDFGGSSVFYHVLSGSKVFYFIEPTAKNLKKYQKWSSSPDQGSIFFGDEVKKCYAVHLKAGNTMLIPSGWIHAVYTPEDAVVIGGNFLHSLGISMQLRIYEIEELTSVPQKFRFPHYELLNWYAALHYKTVLADQSQRDRLSTFELEGIASLAKWLQTNAERFLQKDFLSYQRRKLARHDNIPKSIQHVHEVSRSLVAGIELCMERLKQQIRHDHKPVKESPKKEEANGPKLVLKLNPDATEEHVSDFENDQEFVFEDDEEESTEEELVETEDDDEYQEDNQKKPMQSSRKRSRRSSSVDSSSDDDLGTSNKRQRNNRTERINNNSAKKKSPSTVKQRLLERMAKGRINRR